MDHPTTIYAFLSPVFEPPHPHPFSAIALVNLGVVGVALALARFRSNIFPPAKRHAERTWGTVAYGVLALPALFLIPTMLLGALFFFPIVHHLPRWTHAHHYRRATALVVAALIAPLGMVILTLADIHYAHIDAKANSFRVFEDLLARTQQDTVFSPVFAKEHIPTATHRAYPAFAEPTPTSSINTIARGLGQWAWRATHPDTPLPKIHPFAAGDVMVRVDAQVASTDAEGAGTTLSWPMVFCLYRNTALLDAYTLLGVLPNSTQGAHLREACPNQIDAIAATLALDDVFPERSTASPQDGPAPSAPPPF